MSKSRRERKLVDYSRLGHVEGYSDEEELATAGNVGYDSDSDEYKLEEQNEGENQDKEEDEQVADLEHSGNVQDLGGNEIKQEVMEDYAELLNNYNNSNTNEEEDIAEVATASQKGKGNSSGKRNPSKINERADAPDVQLPPLPRKPGKRLMELMSSDGRGSPSNSMASSPVTPKKGFGENLKDRFQSYYGSNNRALIGAINQRSRWGDSIFTPFPELFEIPEALQEQLAKPHHKPDLLQEQSLVLLENGPSAEYLPDPSSSITCQLNVESQPVTMYPFQCVSNSNPNLDSFNTNQSVVLNAGSHITSVQWATGHEQEVQYLAVGTLDKFGEPSPENISAPEISTFSATGYPSSIQIYQVSPNLETRLFCTISSDYGSPLCFRWRPCFKSHREGDTDESSSLGILAACFQDGKVRVFGVAGESSHDGSPLHYRITKPLREYSFKEDNITCVTWRTPDIIAVGTADGFIAEFDLSDTSEDTKLIPSFYLPFHTSIIVSIASGFPDNEEFLFTSATDGFTRLVDVRDVRRSKTISTRYKSYSTCNAYAYHLCSFLSLEDSFTCKLAPIRRLNTVQAGTSVTKHEGTVMAIGSSFLHPLVLSGAADGTLRIGNIVRRTMVSKRQTNTLYKQGILWQFECSEKAGEERVYRFVDVLKSAPIPKQALNERQVLFPAGSVVTDVDWNPNFNSGSIYAAGLSCGLIRLEKLG